MQLLLKNILVCFLLLCIAVSDGKNKKPKPKKFAGTAKGIQCYHCLSFDTPACWDPEHPDYANITVSNYYHYISGGNHKKVKPKNNIVSAKGIQCYNCLSFDNPACWDPEHPDYANITMTNIDCYIPGMEFVCIIITSESTKLVETGQEIGPIRARTCVPTKDFSKKSVSYSMCSKLSKELAASEIFSRITVGRPQCTLCRKHLCTDAAHC